MLSFVAMALSIAGSARAEEFHHLSGAQIRVTLTGNMLTDDVHWRETYRPGGQLLAEQRGGTPMNGSWHVDGDRLCSNLPGIRDECYAVWIAGDRVQLRHATYQPVEACVRPARPTSR